jgi:hypothetical protein
MAVNVLEFVNKIQEEGLKALKQSQDANIAALAEFRTMSKEFTEKPGTVPALENLPTPAQLVELSFSFAGQFLELRKNYALKIADIVTETQKQTEATFKSAEANFKNATTPVAPVKSK